ncbi:hypothetical protein [Halorarum salinum]|uniref:Uncharacterized protein n=1 Tax=Halorarum salinum TaxID=2743089 RepID=A0A7D5LBC7_9EURY|nr:hypothetical protein [Halobaculum salinum]QLG62826.1 hypothetical protein HUG12_14255 [Halobaculum salinum]
MKFPRSTKGTRSLDERWHRKAEQAKRTTTGLDEWSDREIERWDLDDPARKPTGRKHPETWRYDKPLRRVNRSSGGDRRRDARENQDIGDAEEDRA